MNLPKGIMIGLVIAGGLFLLTMATYLVPVLFFSLSTDSDMSDSPIPTQQPLSSPPGSSATDGPVIVIKPFQRVVTRDGLRELEIQAAEATIDQSTRQFKLIDIENITFYGKDDEQVRVRAGEGFWNQQTNKVALRGNIEATVESGKQDPVHVTCQWLEYDNNLGLLTGGDAVTIRQTDYSATGDKLVLKPQQNHIQLEQNVRAHIQPEVFSERSSIHLDEPVLIECGLMIYNGAADILQFDHSPRVSSGNNLITCGQISVFMDAGNSRIVWKRDCKFHLYPADGNDSPVEIQAETVSMDRNAGSITLENRIIVSRNGSVIQAEDQVSMTLDPDSSRMIGGSAEGNVTFRDPDYCGRADSVSWDAVNTIVIMSGKARLDNNRDTVIEGDLIQLHLERKFYSVTGNVGLQLRGKPGRDQTVGSAGGLLQRLTNRKEDTGEPLVGQARALEINEVDGRISLSGNVRLSQGASRFSGDTLDIGYDPVTREVVDMHAKGNIALSEGDRLMTCGKMDYSVVTGDVEMTENPVMWQGNSQLRAERFIYNEIEKLLKMMDHVDGVVMIESDDSDWLPTDEDGMNTEETQPRNLPPDGSPDPADRYLYLAAGNGTYNEVTGDIQFQDKVVMRRSQWTIHSESLQIRLNPQTGRMISADALGAVHVVHPMFDAKGHSLTYQPETSILVLRGTGTQKCLVTQGERGSQGDEVRFFIRENRFEIDKGISMIMPSEISGTLR